MVHREEVDGGRPPWASCGGVGMEWGVRRMRTAPTVVWVRSEWRGQPPGRRGCSTIMALSAAWLNGWTTGPRLGPWASGRTRLLHPLSSLVDKWPCSSLLLAALLIYVAGLFVLDPLQLWRVRLFLIVCSCFVFLFTVRVLLALFDIALGVTVLALVLAHCYPT